MHDVFTNSAPQNISKLFSYLTEMDSYDTRLSSSGNFYVHNNYYYYLSFKATTSNNFSVDLVPNYGIALLLICANYPTLVLGKS